MHSQWSIPVWCQVSPVDEAEWEHWRISLLLTRERLIRGLILALSNRPLPIPTFISILCTASDLPYLTHACKKCLKTRWASHARNGLGSILACVAYFGIFRGACTAYFCFFLSALQTLCALYTTGWKPVFILALCQTTTVGGRG